MGPTRVYIASPLGFSQLGRRHYEEDILAPLRDLGYAILDPWVKARGMPQEKLISDARTLATETAVEVGLRNSEMIRQADLILAILDGADVDAGVASEVGFAAGIGKRVIAYRGDFRPSGDFVSVPVNAQVAAFVRLSGGQLATDLEEVWSALRREP